MYHAAGKDRTIGVFVVATRLGLSGTPLLLRSMIVVLGGKMNPSLLLSLGIVLSQSVILNAGLILALFIFN